MNSSQSSPKDSQTVIIKLSERWQVYYRLQELDIPCSCSINQPLQIEMRSPLVAIQVWNVVRQINTSRSQLIEWLETCWESDLLEKANIEAE